MTIWQREHMLETSARGHAPAHIKAKQLPFVKSALPADNQEPRRDGNSYQPQH